MNLDKDGNELEEDFMLAHLPDKEILGLMDSYDDGRINKLCSAYVELRSVYLAMLEAM